MSIGAAAVLRLCVAVFGFCANVFYYVGEWAEAAGDPEVSTACALIVVALFASGHYSKNLFALLAFCLGAVLYKDFTGPPAGPEDL